MGSRRMLSTLYIEKEWRTHFASIDAKSEMIPELGFTFATLQSNLTVRPIAALLDSLGFAYYTLGMFAPVRNIAQAGGQTEAIGYARARALTIAHQFYN